MNSSMTSTPSAAAKIIVRLMALALAGVGAFVLIKIAWGVLRNLGRHPSTTSLAIVFVLSFETLIVVYGLWCLRAAYMGWRHRSARDVRWLCAAWATGLIAALPPGKKITLTVRRMMIDRDPDEIEVTVKLGVRPTPATQPTTKE